jgi:putative transcriptional regulator
MAHYLKNHLLIAMPSLNDSYFHRAVVYLCEHDDDGAMGVIINQPTELMLDALLEQVDLASTINAHKTTPVLLGGPVNSNQGMVLHDSPSSWPSSIQVSDKMQLTTSIDILSEISHGTGPDHALVTLGYAGWSAGQLEQEIIDNTWLTVESNPNILFEVPTHDKWKAAGMLLGLDISLLSSTAGHA